MRKSELKAIIKECIEELNELDKVKNIILKLSGGEGEYDPKADSKILKVAKILGLKPTGTSHSLMTKIGGRLKKAPKDKIDQIYKII